MNNSNNGQKNLLEEYGTNFSIKLLRMFTLDNKTLGKCRKTLDSSIIGIEQLNLICSLIYKYYDEHGLSPTIDILELELRNKLGKKTMDEAQNLLYLDYMEKIREVKIIPKELEYFNETINDYIGFRNFVIEAMKMVNDINNNRIDWKQAHLSWEEKRIELNSLLAIDNIGKDWVETVDERIERRRQMLTSDIHSIPTYIEGLDRIMQKGGLEPGQTAVVMATTGGGKTHFLIHITMAAAIQGKFVLFFSLGDMIEDSILDRMDIRQTGIEYHELTLPLSEKKLKRKTEWIKQAGGIIKTIYFEPDTQTIHDLKSHIVEIEGRQQRTVDVVVIDYGSLLIPSIKQSEFRMNERQKYLDIRRLGSNLKVPTWTALQLNREALKKKTSGLGEISEAYRAVDPMDLVLTINQNPEESLENKARLFVSKNRNGPKHRTIPIIFNMATGNIKMNEDDKPPPEVNNAKPS